MVQHIDDSTPKNQAFDILNDTIDKANYTTADIIEKLKSAIILPNCYQRNVIWSSNRVTITTPSYLIVNINNNIYTVTTQQTLNITDKTFWDTEDYTQATNRKGKDFYIYACEPTSGTVPKFILSANSTVPVGFTAENSRKIGGFHCLCADVGTISGHTLSGYVAGDILPVSIWDLKHRPISNPEGMVYDVCTNKWIDIYLASVQSGQLSSVFGGVIADGASVEKFHWYKGSEWMIRVKKDLLTQREFISASLGSNQGTNIASSTDPNTTGGHTDTAGRRMISNIGCEDMCGVSWQLGSEAGGGNTGESWTNAYDSNDFQVTGQQYMAPCRGLFGGAWKHGANCGSRGSYWYGSPLNLYEDYGLRGCAEPLHE